MFVTRRFSLALGMSFALTLFMGTLSMAMAQGAVLDTPSGYGRTTMQVAGGDEGAAGTQALTRGLFSGGFIARFATYGPSFTAWSSLPRFATVSAGRVRGATYATRPVQGASNRQRHGLVSR